jgi:hypothetical protein
MVDSIGPVFLNLGNVSLYNDTEHSGKAWLSTNLVQDAVWEVGNMYDFVGAIYDSTSGKESSLRSTDILGFKNPLQAMGFTTVVWSETGANLDNTTICALDFCLQELRTSVVENKPYVEIIHIKYGTKTWEEHIPPPVQPLDGNSSWSQLCWMPDDTLSTSVKYQYSDVHSDLRLCPYDPHTFAFCSCQSMQYFDWRTFPLIFDGIAGNFTDDSASLSFTQSADGWTFNTTEYEANWQVANGFYADHKAIRYGHSTSTEYNHLYDIGFENFTANLAKTLTNSLRNDSWADVIGSTISMLPQVEVRWFWLALPALLNFVSAVFLALTIWMTRRHKIPLWKTSLVASFFHGLEPELQSEAVDTRVSRMNQESMLLNVQLKQSQVPGKMMFRKAD